MAVRIIKDEHLDYSRTENGLGSFPLEVNTKADQSIGGLKTFTGSVTAANLAVNNLISTNLTATNITANTVTALTTLSAPVVRASSGNAARFAPDVDNATGTSLLRITPSAAGWTTGGAARISFGDSNTYIESTNGGGMTIVDPNGIYFRGATAFKFISSQYGFVNIPATSPLGAGASVSVPVTFPQAFPSAPKMVMANIVMVAGSTGWDRCITTVTNITASDCSIKITNLSASATTGQTDVSFAAIL